MLEPHGNWYTAVTGIRQTVWLDPVPATYVRTLTIAPDAEASTWMRGSSRWWNRQGSFRRRGATPA